MYGIYDADGRVISIYVGGNPFAQTFAEGGDGYAEWPGGDQGAWWRDGDAWALRPALPDELPPAVSNVAFALPFPAGSEVTLTSGVSGEIPDPGGVFTTDTSTTLALPAGAWGISVKPPFPHLPREYEVEVL